MLHATSGGALTMWSVDNTASQTDGSPLAELFIASPSDLPFTVEAGFEISYEDFHNAGFEEKEPAIIQQLSADITLLASSATHRVKIVDAPLNLGSVDDGKIVVLTSLGLTSVPTRTTTLSTDIVIFPMPRGAPTVGRNFSFVVTFSIERQTDSIVVAAPLSILVDSVCLQVIARPPAGLDTTTAVPTASASTTGTTRTSSSTIVTTATTTTATTLPTSTTTTAPTTSTKLSFVRPPVGTTKPRPGDTIGVVDPEDGPGLDPMTNIRTVIGTVPRDEDTVTPTLSSTNSASSATPTTIRDTDTSSGTVLTPSSTLTTTDTVGGYPVLGDTPSSVDSGLSALDIIGVGGFVGIGIGACLLFGALVAIVIVCAKRQKTPSQTEQVSSSSEMQSARSQRGNDKEAAPVNDEYVAPPKFTLNDEYGDGEFTTQV